MDIEYNDTVVQNEEDENPNACHGIMVNTI